MVACFFGIEFFLLAFAVTLGHAIILGLPVALLYRVKHWTRLDATLAASFLIGAIPVGLLNWPMTNASVDGIPAAASGIPTAAAWVHYVEDLAMFGGLGAVGGLTFWLTLKRFGVLEKIDPVTRSGGGGSPFWMRGLLVPFCALGLLGCAVWLVTAHYAALADGRVQIVVGIVVLSALGIAAVLFARQGKSGFVIDKRNVWDTTRFQWRKRIAEDRDRSDRG
jgi:hypothetical protein